MATVHSASDTGPGWASLLVTALCRGLLVMLASMALWAVLPAALGWQVTVVMSGSMEPALRPGDVIASRPISGSAVRPGQVVLVDDPDHAGRLRLHRLVKITDAHLVLRGDANRSDDSTPVRRNAVHGVGSLRVPFIGAPAYWLRTHQITPLIPTGLALILVALGAIGRREKGDPPDDDTGSSMPETDRPGGRRSRRSRRKTLVVLTTVALTAATVATNAPAQAATAFRATVANPTSSWTAGYFSCSAAVKADAPYLYYPLSEKSGTTAADASGNARNGAYSSLGVSYGAAGPCARDNATGVTLDGTTGAVSTPGPISGPQQYTQEIWFRTTSSLGGSLIGFASSASGLGLDFDRQLYLTASGKLVAGVHPRTSNQTITSSASYNDGAWHLADVTLSPTTGLTLYVDGAPVVANAGLKGAQDFSGYWRFGDTPLTGWPSAPLGSHFSGSLQGAAIFPAALSASQVAAHYAAR